MSLSEWFLGKEMVFEKIKKEVVKLFLVEKEKELEYEGKLFVRFQIENLIDIIAKNLSMKKDTVSDHILTLLINRFISIDFMDNIYYYHNLPEDLKKLVLDPLDHNSIITLHLRRLLRIEKTAELEKEIKELTEDLKQLVLDPLDLDPIDHNSIIRLEIKRLLETENAPELEKEIKELKEAKEACIALDLEEDLW